MTVTIDAVHLVEMAARWRAAVPNVGMVCEDAHGRTCYEAKEATHQVKP